MDGPEDQDYETGEMMYDQETGEEVVNQQQTTASQATEQPRDAETGEPWGEEQQAAKKKPFQIPRSALKHQPSKNNSHHLMLYNDALSSTNCIEKKVERVSQNVSPIVFLLPTLFLFPGWATIPLIVFELVSHAWIHQKNKLKGNCKLMYRSPLNMITSEFCAICRSDALMDRIGKLQDQRLMQVHTRKIAYCSYMEKMSVVT